MKIFNSTYKIYTVISFALFILLLSLIGFNGLTSPSPDKVGNTLNVPFEKEDGYSYEGIKCKLKLGTTFYYYQFTSMVAIHIFIENKDLFEETKSELEAHLIPFKYEDWGGFYSIRYYTFYIPKTLK